MARWFRSHAGKLHNRKVQRLSDAHYRAWDSLLCVAALYDGVLPPIDDVAFELHRPPAAAAKLIEALIAARLFDRTERGIEPHDWNEWQYLPAVSTERVQRHRERRRNACGNAARNAPGTDSETQRDRGQSSEEPGGSSAPAALAGASGDPVKSIFDQGVALLVRHRTPERRARSLVGQWRAKARDDGRVASLIREAVERDITEPIAWIAKRLAAAEAGNDPWAGVDI
jgi:hypothetical protein